MPTQWRQLGFAERLDEWIVTEAPDDHLRRTVTAWTLTRLDDPYEAMRRQSGFANLWFGRVPGTHRSGMAVFCSLWIDEANYIVRCDRIGSLSLPT